MRNNQNDHENRPRKNGLTDAERQTLVDRHFERAEFRQIEDDLNFIKLIQLGEATGLPLHAHRIAPSLQLPDAYPLLRAQIELVGRLDVPSSVPIVDIRQHYIHARPVRRMRVRD